MKELTTGDNGTSNTVTPEGHHIALAEEKTELTDKVSYDGLTSGKTYTLKTVLMDRTTGTVVQDKNGKDISLETKFKVHFWNRSGTVEVPVVIDARGLEGHTVVFFEYLYDEDGKEIGRHTDIDDEDQTIVFPKAETEASDEVTKTNIVLPAEDIRVKDILKYENLLVGKEYLVTGMLMDKKTGEAVLDDNGQPVTTSKRFTAEKKDGEVEMLFEFSGVKLAGTVMVAFEKVSISGVEIMAHADINDEDQTIYEPSIRTSASDKETGEKEFEADGVRTICDHVVYEALPKGRYVLVGTLMNKETGGAFVNAEGKELTAEKEFEVTEMSGKVDVEFTVDAAAFAGRSVVVFEKAFSVKEDDTREETPAAVHEDISDEEQTVSFPKIGTVLLDKDTESHCAKASEKVTHIDTVTYSGLIVGKEYTAKGRLVDKETGEPVLDGGKEVTAEKKFTAETASGKVEIVFTFNASALEGKAVVAFEDLYRDKKPIASHADLSDEDQTIRYPKIGTELRDSGSGTHYTTAVDDAVLIDTVTYSNLIAGRKYNVVGVLMDKETGAQVQAEGEAVRAAAEFTPEGPDGTVELSFRISGPALAGKTVVAFEVLYDDGKEVAAHEEMDDEAQTVYSPGIRTEFINNESNSHYAEAENPRNFTDTVYYTNLMPGRSYTVSGTLVDKSTGKNLMIGGSEVTAEKTFTPEEKDGIVELSFEFDCSGLTGKSVVAYEFLYRDGIMITGHADINDEAQTVTIGKKPTLTPTVTPIPPTKVPGRPSTPSTPGTTTRSAPVRTGDTTNIILPVILLGASAAVIAALLIRRKKKA